MILSDIKSYGYRLSSKSQRKHIVYYISFHMLKIRIGSISVFKRLEILN